MPTASRNPARNFIGLTLVASCALLLPVVTAAQNQWTGIGAISGTAMFMDTTTIVRVGDLREVWIKSLDSTPKNFVAGKDTLTFDTVVGLNVFDCSKGTRTVSAVRYLLGDELVLDVRETHDKPATLRPNSFFHAIYNDLCRQAH